MLVMRLRWDDGRSLVCRMRLLDVPLGVGWRSHGADGRTSVLGRGLICGWHVGLSMLTMRLLIMRRIFHSVIKTD